MHYYLLDPQGLSLADFERKQASLLALTHEFNISGEVGRLSTIRGIEDLVYAAEKRQVSTLVVCGTDDTFNRVLGALGKRRFVIGFIPLSEDSQIAKLLGIDSLASAVKVLAARRITLVDTAKIGTLDFFSYLEFGVVDDLFGKKSWLNIFSQKKIHIIARINNQYLVSGDFTGGVVVNAKGWPEESIDVGSPTDGQLDFVSLSSRSVFGKNKTKSSKGFVGFGHDSTKLPLHTIEFLEPAGLPLTMLGRQVARIPAKVTISPSWLQLIVGKNRTF
jgi:hypothetical protein